MIESGSSNYLTANVAGVTINWLFNEALVERIIALEYLGQISPTFAKMFLDQTYSDHQVPIKNWVIEKVNTAKFSIELQVGNFTLSLRNIQCGSSGFI